MEESFEQRPLLDRDLLRSLQKREDLPSLIHLALHLGAFLLLIALVVWLSPRPLAAFLASIMLGAVWASLFAPFHEFTHQTPFKSRRLNFIGAWLTGVPFGMAPMVYRDFHFAHHRYTHYLDKDPELSGAMPTFAGWPTAASGWAYMIAGLWLMWLKVRLMFRLALSSADAEMPPPFDDPELRSTFIQESRIVAVAWASLPLLALSGIRGAGWILFALIPCHVFQAIWLTAEHTGLPHEGTILDRTRTVHTPEFISWWLWNMNYHAEHHAWPSIPWHALPSAHQHVATKLSHQSWGYLRLQIDVLHQTNLPDGARPLQSEPHS
jgi:fatty acid desaturase